ncbi:MAG: cytochrome c1 [Salibaculum sp.]|jgi:ubiquinol-cytochrome c reductase cytochrome c1 subunit|uniref:cytochrome c1 n=1 Tax=Roseovarius halophilus (ex Wu et al. 2025) TaxID=3376060 RepID=UPI00287059C3|nr:cytochrome c1 [Salibaculum sp.]MDR9426617.1 cytochrome c1 [Salibaculum sp.]MDR9483086.1 cytochrome c1 [Salibaculum sp.]
MIRTLSLTAAVTLGLATGASAAGAEGTKITDYAFSFEGPFGSYDQFQLQRGLQIYTEVCSACHGLKFVNFRNLSDAGGPDLPEDQMRAYAEQFFLSDFDAPENQDLIDPDTGDQKTLTPSDHFPANDTQGAPDLSLMAKARAGFSGPYGTGISQLVNGMGGPEYIASLLTGYTGETKDEAGTLLYENDAYAGGYINMAPPLYDEGVVYADGTEATIEQQAEDVAAFLMWTAEPKMMARKQAGLTGVIFLTVLAVLLYMTNKRIWAPHKKTARKD